MFLVANVTTNVFLDVTRHHYYVSNVSEQVSASIFMIKKSSLKMEAKCPFETSKLSACSNVSATYKVAINIMVLLGFVILSFWGTPQRSTVDIAFAVTRSFIARRLIL
jgi:hypothetical protein